LCVCMCVWRGVWGVGCAGVGVWSAKPTADGVQAAWVRPVRASMPPRCTVSHVQESSTAPVRILSPAVRHMHKCPIDRLFLPTLMMLALLARLHGGEGARGLFSMGASTGRFGALLEGLRSGEDTLIEGALNDLAQVRHQQCLLLPARLNTHVCVCVCVCVMV
jgi:hypothetical protein